MQKVQLSIKAQYIQQRSALFTRNLQSKIIQIQTPRKVQYVVHMQKNEVNL